MKRYSKFFQAGVVITILLGILIVLFNTKFRLVSTNAQGGRIASSSSSVVLNFSQQITNDFDKSANNITFTPKYLLLSTEVQGKTIKFNIDSLSEKDNIEIKINTIESTKNKNITNFHKSFKVKYVPFNKLSSSEKANQINANDTIEKQFPIINSLPITTEKYTIYYTSIKDNKLVIVVDVLGVNQLNIDDPDTKQFLLNTRELALKSLTDKGYDLKAFEIQYQEDIEGISYPQEVPRD